ncbi:hypothetical protein ABPG75_007536 [Micractinium tetrahymenae]
MVPQLPSATFALEAEPAAIAYAQQQAEVRRQLEQQGFADELGELLPLALRQRRQRCPQGADEARSHGEEALEYAAATAPYTLAAVFSRLAARTTQQPEGGAAAEAATEEDFWAAGQDAASDDEAEEGAQQRQRLSGEQIVWQRYQHMEVRRAALALMWGVVMAAEPCLVHLWLGLSAAAVHTHYAALAGQLQLGEPWHQRGIDIEHSGCVALLLVTQAWCNSLANHNLMLSSLNRSQGSHGLLCIQNDPLAASLCFLLIAARRVATPEEAAHGVEIVQQAEQRYREQMAAITGGGAWSCPCGPCAAYAGLPLTAQQQREVAAQAVRVLWSHSTHQARWLFLGDKVLGSSIFFRCRSLSATGQIRKRFPLTAPVHIRDDGWELFSRVEKGSVDWKVAIVALVAGALQMAEAQGVVARLERQAAPWEQGLPPALAPLLGSAVGTGLTLLERVAPLGSLPPAVGEAVAPEAAEAGEAAQAAAAVAEMPAAAGEPAGEPAGEAAAAQQGAPPPPAELQLGDLTHAEAVEAAKAATFLSPALWADYEAGLASWKDGETFVSPAVFWQRRRGSWAQRRDAMLSWSPAAVAAWRRRPGHARREALLAAREAEHLAMQQAHGERQRAENEAAVGSACRSSALGTQRGSLTRTLSRPTRSRHTCTLLLACLDTFTSSTAGDSLNSAPGVPARNSLAK